ncbi:4Fe-4S binding protein [Candidatus Woesearchaeota archaeon]|jgi:Fe-S-cluster-containing dehydrogenase component|nr:4Fe-4S binding protein [Candidatus Woesearchaeota archaeon]
MARILEQFDGVSGGYSYPDGAIPTKVTHFKHRCKPSEVTLSNKMVIESACVQCSNASCMEIPINNDVFDSLKMSQTDLLCPTNSIAYKDKEIYIDSNCIKCGLCISACPVGAIFFNENNDVEIRRADENFTLQNEKLTFDTQTIDVIHEQPSESEDAIRQIISNIQSLTSKGPIMNKLVVKSFESIGFSTYITRSGDVNLRMDALSKEDDIYYPIEIEISANLDAPRDILDDVAVFCSRQNVSKDNVIGIIVLGEIPNKRTEYWELISDIESVTGVKIATIPIAALLTCVWNKKPINVRDYFLGKGRTSVRSAINQSLGREINVSPNSNLLEAVK